MQRSLPSLPDAAIAFSSLYQRGQLIRPGVEGKFFDQFANFGKDSFPDATVIPAQLRSLIALNALIDRVGIHRRNEDLLWINTSNQLAGRVDPETRLNVVAYHLGELEVPLSEVAAMKGGGGFGRPHVVYLRDGGVLVGKVSAAELVLTMGDEAEGQQIDLANLNLLLLRTGKRDGLAPEGTQSFAELSDGSVLSLADDKDQLLNVMTPWGRESVPLSEIAEAGYISSPSPGMRIVLNDSSRYTVFLTGEPLNLLLVGGESIDIASAGLRRIWRAGASQLSVQTSGPSWLDLSEVNADVPGEGFLIRGNNLVAGSFLEPSLTLVVNGTEMRLAVELITGIKRVYYPPGESGDHFVVDLKNGDQLRGDLTVGSFVIERAGSNMRLPLNDLIAYQRQGS
tara:strand:- start:3510 stop:4700 length:1191 start_codon:yes stop_codon:yes gene_type:complete